MYVQPADTVAFLREYDFNNTEVINDGIIVDGIEVIRTSGDHGRGELDTLMDAVSGFILKSEGNPTVYIVGDYIYTPEIQTTIDKYDPDWVILNSGGAIVPDLSPELGPILMNENDVVSLIKSAPAKCRFIAVHMEAIDHCQTTRGILRNEADRAGISKDKLIIPLTERLFCYDNLLIYNMIKEYISNWDDLSATDSMPWEVTSGLCDIITAKIDTLGEDYAITDGVAVHKSARIGHNVTIKAPAIIGPDCFVGANSYLRNGVWLVRDASVGISCEIKTSVMLANSAVAHFNFVGDSIIGNNVNIEAGAIVANHFNEREDKTIFVRHHGERICTGVKKFGSLIGDNCRIGANAVLSPGSLLLPGAIVRRLELIEQDPHLDHYDSE